LRKGGGEGKEYELKRRATTPGFHAMNRKHAEEEGGKEAKNSNSSLS